MNIAPNSYTPYAHALDSVTKGLGSTQQTLDVLISYGAKFCIDSKVEILRKSILSERRESMRRSSMSRRSSSMGKGSSMRRRNSMGKGSRMSSSMRRFSSSIGNGNSSRRRSSKGQGSSSSSRRRRRSMGNGRMEESCMIFSTERRPSTTLGTIFSTLAAVDEGIGVGNSSETKRVNIFQH